MKIFFFVLFLFSMMGCLPEAEVSISKVSDNPISNPGLILTLKYTSKGSGALVADQIEVGTAVDFRPTTTGGTPLSFSITPSLPAGFSFNTNNGAITGTPTGYFAPTLFTVTATNDFGSIDQNVTLGSSYGSFAMIPTVDSVSSIIGNKNVAIGVKAEFSILSGVAGTYSCKIETITGDDLTTLTGIFYNSTNCKIETTAIPTIYFPNSTTFVATLTRTEDNQTVSSSLDIQIFNNPVISSFIIENGQGPAGVLDSRGGTIAVTGINFEAGDEFYDTTNPSSEVLLNGQSCSTIYSSTSIKCILSEITPGTRKFKIKRATGASNEKELVVFNTAPSIEVRNPATFPTNSQKAFTYDSFPFDSTIEFIISTGPTETERNAESAVIELATDLYSGQKSFIDWDIDQCAVSSMAGGFKKLTCTLKPSGDRVYGLVNLKVTAYELGDTQKTTTIDGDFVRFPFNLTSSPIGTYSKGVDPFPVLSFNFKISSIDHFKNLLEVAGGYSPYLGEDQYNPLRNGSHGFTFDDLDFTSVDDTFLEFLDNHKHSSGSTVLKGKITGDCSKPSTITGFPLSKSGAIASWFDSFRGSIRCLTFNDLSWVITEDQQSIETTGLISKSAILEGIDSSISITNADINLTDKTLRDSGILFGHLTLNRNLKINSGIERDGVLNLNLRNRIEGSGTWHSFGFIAGDIDGTGKIYGTFSGKMTKTGGSDISEKFGLISGELASGFGVSSERSYIRGELSLEHTNLFNNHGSVGVISGLASGVEVLNTQLVSTIFSSGKNFNEAGIFGTGENILITDVVNDVQFIKNGNLTIKGAGLIGTMFTRIILSNYNSVVLAADYTLNTNETIKGGALFSNCSSGDVGIEKTYIVTPKIIDLALTDNNNCSFTSDPSNLIVSGTAKLSSSEPNPSTPIWTWRESVILTDRLSEVPVWLTNCIQTPIGTTGIDTLIGFCVGDREIIPTDGSFTVDFPAFITHFSELLALSFSPTVVEGGYLNLGSSFNLEGLANFFITNGVDGNSPFRLNLTGNTAELKLPESNMPFFLGRFQNSTITNTKLFKKSSTTVDSSRWLTTHPDFASSGGVSLIFDEFIYSTFQGEINFDINYVMNNLIWTHTSLFGYLLQGSTFNVNIKGDFVVTNEAQPASSPLLIFSGFYKGEGGANYVINSNSLNLDLTVLTPFCSDPSMGISGSWGFNISDGSPTISSSTYSGTSALRVYCRDDNPPILNLCSIPSIDVAEALNCQASRAP